MPEITPRPTESGDEQRRWHFWCHGCKAEKIETLADLDAESAAALAWFAEHDGHRLGGFIEPIEEGALQ